LKYVEDAVTPVITSSNQVLVGVVCAGLNPVDTYIRAGQYGQLPLPYTPGSDASGRVLAVGDGVSGLQAGQRVYVSKGPDGDHSGACASHLLAPEASVNPLPDRLTFQQGAGVGVPYFTAWHALLQRAGAKTGDNVLIHGASGAVGLAAAQIAKHHGMTVFGTAGTAEGLELVRAQGADHVFNHRTPGYAGQIGAASGGGVDVILEMLANVNLVTDLELLKFRGRVVVIGARGNIDFSPRLTMGKETSIMGCALASTTKDEWAEVRQRVTEGLEAGWLTPVVDKVYPLQKAATAHEDIIGSTGAMGNLVLEV